MLKWNKTSCIWGITQYFCYLKDTHVCNYVWNITSLKFPPRLLTVAWFRVVQFSMSIPHRSDRIWNGLGYVDFKGIGRLRFIGIDLRLKETLLKRARSRWRYWDYVHFQLLQFPHGLPYCVSWLFTEPVDSNLATTPHIEYIVGYVGLPCTP